jgi:hypothetical protein
MKTASYTLNEIVPMNVINPYDRELQLYRSISSLIRRYIRNTISI